MELINNRPKISVAMATYNGEEFIKEQIDSILLQLNSYDEIVISDDGSTDKTIDIIKRINDKRIKLLKGPKKGINKNFENAINNCEGEYIFLSDQDDIWENNKIDTVIKYFNNKEILLVRHNAIVIDKDDNIIHNDLFEFKKIKSKDRKLLKTIITNNYQGCAMAFRRELLPEILLIPSNIYLYDLWIGLIALLNGETIFVPDKLIRYRRYESNNSRFYKRNNILIIIKRRIICILCVLKYCLKKGGHKNK